ncbi:MAG TPA: hypothetical protein VML50_12300 [Anaeromyxobacter sp.]|nr:hypothetical protein [Anaeromyxobacter sp.]
MAEGKKGGFHALEKRIHEIEDEDQAQEKKASEGKEGRPEPKREAPPKK